MKNLLALFISSFLALAPLAVPAVVLADPTNLAPNPSVEQNTNNLPTSWTQNKWGTNATTFTYDTVGQDGSRSLNVKMTSYTSGDAKWYFTPVTIKPNTNYTFTDYYKSTVASDIDADITTTANRHTYKYLGATVASPTWRQASFTFKTGANASKVTIFHYIHGVGELSTDNFSLIEGTGTPPPPPPPPTPPVVNLTAPASGATVSGSTAVSANANDAQGITNVQFKLDGNSLGSPDTTAPYSISWDTTTSANGTHGLSAVATNTAGLSAASATVNVTVSNVAPPPPPPPGGSNLILNPSLETAAGTQPQSWLSNSWGSNTSTFSYLNTGHTGTRSVKAQITNYTSGDAKWYYNPVNVTGGTSYQYQNWYQSNADSEIDAVVLMNDGSTQYFYITTAPASSAWAQVNATFTVPAGARALAIYQILARVGYVTSDDYSLTEYIPAQFNRGIVSLTFDDGWRSIYTNGLPLLNRYNLVSTQYLLTSTIDYPDYMTIAMMAAFRDQGSEIAAHTVNHLDLTQQNSATVNYELSQNQTDLQNWLGVPVTNFATPYGAYNTSVINSIRQYYRSHRSTDVGFNSKDNFNINNIRVQNITNTVTPAQVRVWVDQAIREKTWLVIVYHEVSTNPEDVTYAVTLANLDQELSYIRQSGVSVQTVNQALNELSSQL